MKPSDVLTGIDAAKREGAETLRAADRAIGEAEKLLTVAEVAFKAQCSERTVWNHIRAGLLPVHRWLVGRKNRTRVLESVANRYAEMILRGCFTCHKS